MRRSGGSRTPNPTSGPAPLTPSTGTQPPIGRDRPEGGPAGQQDSIANYPGWVSIRRGKGNATNTRAARANKAAM